MSSPALPSQNVNVAPITCLLSLEVSPDSRLNQLPKDLIKYILLPMMVTKSRQDYKLLSDLEEKSINEYMVASKWKARFPQYKVPYFKDALKELDILVGQEILQEQREREELVRGWDHRSNYAW